MPGPQDKANRKLDLDLVYGSCSEERLVACEHCPAKGEEDRMRLYQREGSDLHARDEPFHPFLWVESIDLLDGIKLDREPRTLQGNGPLRHLAAFPCWAALERAVRHLKERTGRSPGAGDAPYVLINDPVQQFLMATGRTLFKGMPFTDLRRMQVDIETATTAGYDFPNPKRAEDRILAIALAGEDGWTEVLDGSQGEERELLQRFAALVRERDPDLIEGHNQFKFDWPYLIERARRCKVKLALGRDGSIPRVRPGRFGMGERLVSYPKVEIFGRQLIDTLFLLQIYDNVQRALDGFGLKEAAEHFGVAAPGRTLIEGHDITRVFREDPERGLRYARDDIVETRALADILLPMHFALAQMLPMTLQNVCVRGSGSKIDALLLRAYLGAGHALPYPNPPESFEGGTAAIFYTGLAHGVQHCDARSLYPSLMLRERLAPASDELGVFLQALEVLREERLRARQRMQQASGTDHKLYEAQQNGLKVLINSFYGYLGFSQGRFNDFDAAARVAASGRALLQAMVDQLRKLKARPIEIDTDGIYFIPPELDNPRDEARFRAAFRAALPAGVDVEFDGSYRAMFSYKIKNYALLTGDGEVIIKGAALKSRGLEPFQRTFLREMLQRILTGKADTLPELRARYEEALREHLWPISMLAKTETLQDAPERYAAKRKAGRARRSAAYELALAADRPYQAGDQITYYITGNRKQVAAVDAARLASEWDPANRDENIPYYLAKLDSLYQKFSQEDGSP